MGPYLPHISPASPLHLPYISRASPQVRIEVYKPDEISDDELARSNTIQKSVSSFTRSFTLTGRKKEKKEEEKKEEAAAAGGEAAREEEKEEKKEEKKEEEKKEEAAKPTGARRNCRTSHTPPSACTRVLCRSSLAGGRRIPHFPHMAGAAASPAKAVTVSPADPTPPITRAPSTLASPANPLVVSSPHLNERVSERDVSSARLGRAISPALLHTRCTRHDSARTDDDE